MGNPAAIRELKYFIIFSCRLLFKILLLQKGNLTLAYSGFTVNYMIRIFIVLTLLFIHVSAFCQNNTDKSYTVQNSYSAAAKETFSTKNILLFGTVLGSSFLSDEILQDSFTNNQAEEYSAYSNFSNEFGETSVMLPALAVSCAVGLSFHNDRLTRTAINSGKAFLAGALITESIKETSGRPRPYVGEDTFAADPFEGTSVRYKSFPSWHTFVSWSVITPFAEEYSRILYIVPVSTGLARIYKNKHWTSDVVMGAGIGLFTGLFFHKQSKKKVLFSGNGIIVNY